MSRVFFALVASSLLSIPGYTMDPNSCEAALSFLGRSAEPLLIDSKPDGLNDGLLSFRQLLINTHPDEFNAIWRMVSEKDLMKIHEMAQAGELHISDDQLTRLNALVDFVKADSKKSLWDQDGAWGALHTNYPAFIPPAHRGQIDGNIGGVSTYTFGQLVDEILARLAGDEGRLGVGTVLDRIFTNPRKIAETFVKYESQFLERAEHIQDGLREIELEVGEERPNFTTEEKQKVDMALAELHQARRNLRDEVSAVFGQDITTGGFQVLTGEGITDIYKVYDRLIKGDVVQSETRGDYVKLAEKTMTILEEALNASRIRTGKPARTEDDQGKYHLRVRHHEERRKRNDATSAWLYQMSHEINHHIQIDYHWYETEIYWETETYTDADGKTKTRPVMKTRQVRKDGTARQRLDYHDILVSRGRRYRIGASYRNGTIDHTRGWGNILNDTQALYEAEKSIYKANDLISNLMLMLENHDQQLVLAKRDRLLKEERHDELGGMHEEVMDAIQLLKHHTNRGFGLWSGDNKDHFVKRNETLKNALLALLEVLEIYDEQWERNEFELITTANAKDRSEALDRIERRWLWKSFGLGTAASLLGGAGLCEAITQANGFSCLTELWLWMQPYLSSIIGT